MTRFHTVLHLAPRVAGHALVFLLVLEVCCRIEDRVRWGAPWVGPYSSEALRMKDTLGWRNRPNARYEKWRIDDRGFRVHPAATSAGAPTRILVLGASETFGLYESAGMEYPAQLAADLDVRFPGQYEVLNAAVAGMSLPNIVPYYRDRLRPYHAELTVLYPSPSAYLDIAPPRYSGGAARSTPPPRFELRLPARTYNLLRRFVPLEVQAVAKRFGIWRYRRRHPADWVWSSPPPDRLLQFEQDLRALLEEITASGSRVIIMTHANRFPEPLPPEERLQLLGWRRFFPRAGGESLIAADEAGNEIMRRLAREMDRITLADIGADVGGRPELFADFAHFNDRGAGRVALLLTDVITGDRTAARAAVGPDHSAASLAEQPYRPAKQPPDPGTSAPSGTAAGTDQRANSRPAGS